MGLIIARCGMNPANIPLAVMALYQNQNLSNRVCWDGLQQPLSPIS